jgi:hypothetical protein
LALATNATEINAALPTLATFNKTREGIFISIDRLENIKLLFFY